MLKISYIKFLKKIIKKYYMVYMVSIGVLEILK